MTTALLPPDALLQIKSSLLSSSLPGAAGGLVLFLYGLKSGHLKNNKHWSKATIGARGRRQAFDPARRRAYRQPRLSQRRSGDGAAGRAAQGRRHHLHGDARPAL